MEHLSHLLEDIRGHVRKWDHLIRCITEICRQNCHRPAGGRSQETDLPSSMFLMRTLRWATALSTVNCWLSEVIRLTWVAMAMMRSNVKEGGAVCSTGVVESKFESASLVGPFILVVFHLPPPVELTLFHMSFFGLSSALFRVSPRAFSANSAGHN